MFCLCKRGIMIIVLDKSKNSSWALAIEHAKLKIKLAITKKSIKKRQPAGCPFLHITKMLLFNHFLYHAFAIGKLNFY